MAGKRGNGVKSFVAVILSLAVGGWILYAALLKAADPALFADQIRGYKIFSSLSGFGAYAFLWAEIIIGMLLIFFVCPRLAQGAFIALMLLFVGVTAWSWAHGNVSSCGCFGRMSSRAPKDVILEDMIAVVVAAVAFRVSPWLTNSRGRWMAYGLLLPVFLASPWILPRLPIDSLVTPVSRGASLEDLAAEDLKVPLGEGQVFLALLGPDCRSCVDALPMMEALQKESGAPAVTAVFAGDRSAKRAWALEHVPAFPLAHAPVKSLRQYYRTLPVFMLLDQGKVRQVWWNRVPQAAEVMAKL